MPGPSSSTQGNDSRPAPRSLEELMDAPAAPDPEALLTERGEMLREFGQRMMTPLPELADDLLREGGA